MGSGVLLTPLLLWAAALWWGSKGQTQSQGYVQGGISTHSGLS